MAETVAAPGDGPSAALDRDIDSLRTQIRVLSERRAVLAASILSNTTTREAFRQAAPSSFDLETEPVLFRADAHAQINLHRVAFSTTSFPFKDQSPHSESPNLLGVRIDICARNGKYVKPYYLLLKRVGRDRKSLRVHRHTIPVFIPLRQLEERYLPAPTATSETDNDNLKPSKPKKQDLKKLLRELRRELVSWHLRSDAVHLLREELGLPKNSSEDDAVSTVSDNQEPGPVAQKLGIISLAATSTEARYIRIEWQDGRVGRIKISNQGFVERAIIIGDDGKDDITASLCTGGDGRIETLLQRLPDAQRPD